MGFQLQQCGFLDTLILAFESEQRTDPGPDCGNLYIAGQAFEFVLGDSSAVGNSPTTRTR